MGTEAAPITLTTLVSLTGVVILIVGGFGGVIYRGLAGRLTEHGHQIDGVTVGIAELRGDVGKMGAQLDGRINLLAQEVHVTNGRLTRAEGQIDDSLVRMINLIETHGRVLEGLIEQDEDLRKRR